MSDSLPNWSFFVDTGGTFTDCLALDPYGTTHRAKVLSRGSLSARIASIESGNCLRLDGSPDWPDGFPLGFRLVGKDGECRVSGWNKAGSILHFEVQLPSSLQIGDAIELLSGEEAPVLGQRLILARAGLSPKEISATMRLATTRCTNALLEGKGIEPVLFITKGFPNLLEIGDQRRIDLFDLVPKKRPVLHGPVVEVGERLDRDGEVLQVPDLSALESEAREFLADGHRVAVVSFLHSYLNDEHEKAVGAKLLEWGFKRVILSSEVRRFRKWLPRCESAVVEAYLSDVLNKYLDAVESGLGEGAELLVSSSSGGLS
ncbi:MAG: hydantoinase/oxoprolinase N-terminal domain-containing protein, partial [Opitutae bacterium]